jgi:hypothetical protein
LLPLKVDKLIPQGINVAQVEHSRYGDNGDNGEDKDSEYNESILSPVDIPEVAPDVAPDVAPEAMRIDV